MRPLTIILITFFSTTLLHASPSDSESGDRFNFSSLVGRGGPSLLASPRDLPDGIKAVDVKDEGNENDPKTGLGMVIQEYSIAQTEVTARQYCNYLNVVATGDNYLLFYNEKMGSDPNVASIKRVLVDGKNQYSVIQDKQGDRGNFPIVHVNLYQAARFCNWLQNQSTPGLIGDALTERGAYTLNGKSSGPIARNPKAVWFIPTENEWYKPAYYKGGGLKEGYWNFANRSDWAPSTSLAESGVNNANYNDAKKRPPYLTTVDYFKKSVGAYNTYDMSGNVAEWVATEENQGVTPLKYVARGASWKSLYYGATLESKFDVADWGIELSKWSRPAYDPAQGYDNIGFRVATSLIVNPVLPDTAAPGAAELTPTETVEAPLIALVGVAALFSGKKIYECRRDAETERVAEAGRRGQDRQRTAGDPTTVNQGGTERDPSATARIGERKESTSQSPFLEDEVLVKDFENRVAKWNLHTIAGALEAHAAKRSLQKNPEKLSMTQSEKEEIEASIEGIDPLFTTAVQKYQDYKSFLETNEKTSLKRLEELREMCDAYDAYATAVATTADNIKTQFSANHEVWIPWYSAAMNVSSEAMILRHAAIRLHYLFNAFILLDEPLKAEVLILRYNSNQKTLQYIETIKKYRDALQAAMGKQENPSQPNAVAAALQKIEAEVTSLEVIENNIKKYESGTQTNVSNGTGDINAAYSDYEKAKAKENSNLYALFFLHDRRQLSITNLVRSAELRKQLQLFLSQVQVQQGFFSPGGLSTEDMMNLTTGSGGRITHTYQRRNESDSIGGMNNPQLSMGVPEPDSIIRKGAPLSLERQFKEVELQSGREGGDPPQQSGDDK
ncbi:MAG: SUMF1/EgtB/PvdO family nonheme iron enzyme [Verrucomicrobiae bacterium]|nr:SUMF1/EgtB/PvdO family nonheme iron enzyme [Verrucomicrobiae bacterium]